LDTKEVKEDLDRLENLIKMINFDYNQYFAGNKQYPPLVYEREANKLIRKYNITQLTNTTLRFRFNNLVARYVTFREKWKRKMMEFEGVKKAVPKKVIANKNKPFYQKELDKIPDKYDKTKVVDLIESKIDNFKSKGYNNVDVNIELNEGKIKLKVRPK
jgi:hypothetical protein